MLFYLDVSLKLRQDNVVLTPAYFQGSIESSLQEIFGDIGGQTDLELIAFDKIQKRGILQFSKPFETRVRIAITLIGHYQDIPCRFNILQGSTQAIEL